MRRSGFRSRASPSAEIARDHRGIGGDLEWLHRLVRVGQNFVQLILARIGVGIGEAGCSPAAHS